MSHAHPPAPTFARQIAYTLVTLGAMILAFVVYTTSEKAIDAANEARLRTFLLADELHQSSDDLTRMARLYVVSEHPHARQYHQRILDIREGLQARPDGYSGIYWDLMLVNGRPPRPDSTQRISLVELMRQAGFTAEELDILALAKAQSDRLTQIEREAMAARDARGPDAPERQAQAVQMLHDATYLAAKAAILAPIDQANTLMRERTNGAVARAEQRALLARAVLIACGLILLWMLFRTVQVLRTLLGGSVDDVHVQIARIGRGDFQPSTSSPDAPSGSLLARLIDSQRKLQQMSAERDLTQAELHRSETRLIEAQRLAQLGHWELDLGTYAMHWSHEVYRIFERDPARFTPSCDSILALIHPDDRERVDREFKAAMVSHTPCEIAYRLQGPEGRVKFICQRCEALFDPQGKAVRLIGTMQDVSHILLQDVDSTIATLQGLKALGVKLSIDDFGTGYSSLSYLKRLAVDKLKIDQSFVRDMLTDADGASIVKAIVQLGHNLQLTVIAEGVETESQRQALTEMGCDEAQGYLISRPAPAEACLALLTQA